MPKIGRYRADLTFLRPFFSFFRHDSGTVGNAFGNPQSFSDGIANATDPSQYSTGTPYFLMTGLDETPQDLAKDSTAGFGISEAQILGDVNCSRTDPEDPTCSRISFTGTCVCSDFKSVPRQFVGQPRRGFTQLARHVPGGCVLL